MALMAKGGNQRDFVPCPPGWHAAVCVDVVDLGMEVSGFKNKDGSEKHQHKIRLVWQVEALMENGKPYIVAEKNTLSLGDLANLRARIDSWGIALTQADIDEGWDVEQLVGRTCFINVVHKKSLDGTKTYANIGSMGPLPEGMRVLKARDYIRVADRPVNGQSDPSGHDEMAWLDDVPPASEVPGA